MSLVYLIIFSSINGFNDGQQDFRFFVSAANSNGLSSYRRDEDFSWDAIWKSKATITDFGWVVENSYAALRFSNAKKTNLGLNLREIKRDVQKYTWNRVNTKIGAVITQAGTLKE
jgi:hypothetical protein